MMSYDGAVKIIDFGIAKSIKSSEVTQAGTIKGKLSYLAPEYLEGLELDPRYDQFALGITLWEMLCNRKLFQEANDLAVLKKIQECKIPAPSSINPNVPKELDAIVLKALSKDRNNRYENLDQLNRALMKVLYAKFPDFNATDLSYFSQELFRDEIKVDREKLYEFGKINIRPYIEDLKNELSGSGRSSNSTHSEKIGSEFNFTFNEANSLQIHGAMKSPEKRSEKKAEQIDEKKVDKKFEKRGDKKEPVPDTSNISKTPINKISKTTNATTRFSFATRATGITKINNETPVEKKRVPFITIAALLAVFVGVGAYYEGYFSKSPVKITNTTSAITPGMAKKGPSPASVAVEEATPHGTVFLTHYDKQKMQVFIDGQSEDVDSMSSIKVPLQKEFILRVQTEGKKHFIKTVRVDNSSPLEIEIPEMPIVLYGYMNTSAPCADGEIEFEVFGEKRHTNVPMKQSYGVALPLHMDDKNRATPQKFSIIFIRKGEIKERKFEINIKREDQTIDLCEYL
jgi:serine/threonine-protein kinase